MEMGGGGSVVVDIISRGRHTVIHTVSEDWSTHVSTARGM